MAEKKREHLVWIDGGDLAPAYYFAQAHEKRELERIHDRDKRADRYVEMLDADSVEDDDGVDTDQGSGQGDGDPGTDPQTVGGDGKAGDPRGGGGPGTAGKDG